VDKTLIPLLDALDHLCHQVDGDPDVESDFYGASTPEEMVELAVEAGILIDADDFRALLTSGDTEFCAVSGGWFVARIKRTRLPICRRF
jgi:hypothetical protein